jgi:serine/threonine protein kinase
MPSPIGGQRQFPGGQLIFVAVLINRQLMGAVAHMHSNKVAHRDLKCANIMLKMEYTFINGNLKLLSAEPKIGNHHF